jgi:hypothetical protein
MGLPYCLIWCGKGSDQRCVSKVLPFCISQTLMTIGFVTAAECLRETTEPIWWRRVGRASGESLVPGEERPLAERDGPIQYQEPIKQAAR